MCQTPKVGSEEKRNCPKKKKKKEKPKPFGNDNCEKGKDYHPAK